jgi:hypothetical protein
MKTFSQFMIEANYDPEIQGRSQIRKSGEGGRLYPSKKKTEPEIRRMKAVGGGKMEPVKIERILVNRNQKVKLNNNLNKKEVVKKLNKHTQIK